MGQGAGGERGGPYARLLDVVLTTTGASLAFLVHLKGELLAVKPRSRSGNDLARQASGMAEMAARLAHTVGANPVNMVVLDGQGGRVLLISAGELILGCVVGREADVDSTVSALRRAFEAL